MLENVPQPVRGFIGAVNDGDTDRFLGYFPADGVVNDWGREFHGHDAIRGWSDGEFIGAKGTLTPTSVQQDGDTVTVDGDWASNHFTGPSRFVFVVDGDSVREMRITDH
ncbi:nuclear transport factor 2 family protein [Solicola gregarius]|uniref:Nuclear transport factor 2 family protein n=1 Tax=Solicola gregarius TaxID=2908642 RepID=A0AA46YJE7_9ACTN|nr:nuclear transport factor 2 family protein [Solicola gregarius]UYM03386.1 nuclear transport factor 2 family protein [Solicola gregarius]